MRIRETPAKAGFVLAGIILGVLIAVALALVSVLAGYIWWIVAAIGLFALCARFFRGPQESDAPRPWWRVAATARASAILAALFAVMGVTAFVNAFATPLGAASGFGGIALIASAAVCAYSALRLRESARARS
ncbi:MULTISPECIES: hypothetical protein [unclassified Microbacterium]|uniref:hypothetical protein n=1 Tax=unclassified Microbacterium TaxID=2609290 RepID=UPI0011C449CC|nr:MULTISPECIES: hypothetical protein [unclassified Microbacterium]MBT2484416.1 hypothetical protein [Microbacterium sp. ISL-108]